MQPFAGLRFAFNRTFVELKHLKHLAFMVLIKTFNRTFVELKPYKGKYKGESNNSFNRTFVELKLGFHNRSCSFYELLIALL